MMEYHEMQEEGARRFGVNWLVWNSTIADVASAYIPIHTPKHKLLLTAIAWRICTHLQRLEDLKSAPAPVEEDGMIPLADFLREQEEEKEE